MLLMSEMHVDYLKIAGILDIPKELEEFKDRILTSPFVDWQELPKKIASLDINLAPLQEGIFNEAKSENKWMEASLVKTVTVASDVGAFKKINNGVDGILCKNTVKDWEKALDKLIADKEYRTTLANNAHNRVLKEYVSTYTGHGISKYISVLTLHILAILK